MLIVLSPAKKLDEESTFPNCTPTLPDHLEQSEKLVKSLRRYSANKLAELMNLSPALSELNRNRYQNWSLPFSNENARPALFTFNGDVYSGMEPETFHARDLKFAQSHLRILSGLYGVLRPLDLMQPYRLEMGTALKIDRKQNLYEFWGDLITESLNSAMEEAGSDILINLASNEYFKSVLPKSLNASIVTPVFKEEKEGKLRTLGMFAKRARGMMTAYLIKNKVRELDELKQFDAAGYTFNEELSQESQIVFSRPQPAPVG